MAQDMTGWVRVADLIQGDGTRRTVRRWVTGHGAADIDWTYRDRTEGGSPELWVSEAMAHRIETRIRASDKDRTARGLSVRTHAGSAEDGGEQREPLGGQGPDMSPDSVQALLEGVRTAYEAALAEARQRADEGGARSAELQGQVSALRDRVGELERRCDVAETQTRRARDEADRFRSELERTRLAWHQWRRAIEGWGRWALFRRKLPTEPVEFTAGLGIEDKERRA